MEEKLKYWVRYTMGEFLRLYFEADLEFSDQDHLKIKLEVGHHHYSVPTIKQMNLRLPMLSFKNFTPEFTEDILQMSKEKLQDDMVERFPSLKTEIDDSCFTFIVEKCDEGGYLDYRSEREVRVKS